MADPLSLLHTPAGQPGSGRVRYGGAMALYRAGTLSEAQLEVYREASPHDGRNPLALLAERGLPPPPAAPAQAADRIAALAEAAEDYLATLTPPGAVEVRQALAQRRTPPAPPQPQENPVVARWLAPALAALAPGHPRLAAAIAAAAPLLRWITYDSYPRDQIGDSFASGHAYCTLMGQDAPYPAQDFDFGLFLIAPHVLYRDHHHPAPELYAPLTGPHGWRFGPDRPLVIKPAHQPVWNDAHRPHLTKVGATPFLAFYGWTRDVALPARVIPAADWPELEALYL